MATRRPKGEGSRPDQRADGRWQCYLTLPDDGRGLPAHKRRKWFYGDTASEAAASRRAWQADAAAGRLDTSGNQTVSEYLRWWLATVVAPHLEPSTVAEYTRTVEHHLIPAIGGRRLSVLSAAHIQHLVATKTGAGLARATVEKILRVLRIALNYAVGAELVPRNRARAVRLPADDDPPERVLVTPEQVGALLASVAGTRLGAIVAVTVGVGLRKGEVLGLRWEDVTIDRDAAGQIAGGRLRIMQQTQRRPGVGMVVKGLKRSTARRTIPLPAFCARHLADHRDRQRLARGVAGDAWEETGLVFTTGQGRMMGHQHLDIDWQRASAAVGLADVRFHDLRHACATWLASEGVPLHLLMKILGHTKLPMSLQYIHPTSEGLARAAAVMSATLEGADGQIGGQTDPRPDNHQSEQAMWP